MARIEHSITTERDIKQIFRNKGLRATQGRIVVYQVLARCSHPITHSDIADRLATKGYDRATVYRTLLDFVEAGIAHRADHGDHVWRFELCHEHHSDHETHLADHPHFVCIDCGDVVCLPETKIALTAGKNSPKALKQKKIAVEVRGYCDECFSS